MNLGEKNLTYCVFKFFVSLPQLYTWTVIFWNRIETIPPSMFLLISSCISGILATLFFYSSKIYYLLYRAFSLINCFLMLCACVVVKLNSVNSVGLGATEEITKGHLLIKAMSGWVMELWHWVLYLVLCLFLSGTIPLPCLPPPWIKHLYPPHPSTIFPHWSQPWTESIETVSHYHLL